ncbi:toll-like receptor 4 [Gigantopelta aegis]|uniref:toll-like receptor 4 n=1 Tax=Gigantopelta aegis TaxID=1735272 RepID=UPI001B88C80B|nr:toll-like receptor 4 [Gigantopelta aegis]
MIENSCTTYFGLIIGTVSVVLLLLCTFLGGVMYRYRWKLRYWYYGARYHFKRQQANAENGQMHFEFDAFISYADEDRAFVFNEMIEMVESRAGKKLIIHQRDFVPGQPIVSNILESVKKSRKTVLVLSRDFLKSDWCEYEMQMAVYESAHTGRDVLLVLMLENIPCEVLPKEILHLIQSDSYLEYQADENNDLFWQRFVDAIERI